MIKHRLRSSRPVGARRWCGLAAAALLTAATPLVILGAAPVAAADDCPNAEVIFARGTDEPAGMGRVGDALVDALRPQTGAMNIRTYAVDYKATKTQRHGGDGAEDAIKRIQSTVSACPATKIVLGGYSQGATVMDIVAGVPVEGLKLGDPLPAQYAKNVAAVVTFGNIIGRGDDSIATRSALFGAKALDLCNPGDPICHAGPGNSWRGHTQGYVPEYTDQAATFVADALLAGYYQAVPGYGSQLPGYGSQPAYGYGPQTGYGLPPGPQSVSDPSAQRTEHMPPGWVSDTPAADAHGSGSGPSVYGPVSSSTTDSHG